MNVNTQRRVDRILGVFICHILSCCYRKKEKPGFKAIGTKAGRILIILLSEMGSLVLAHPMFQRIKEKFPDAAIHVLLFEKNREILELLEVVPRENILTIDDASMVKFIQDSLSVMRKMRRMKFDIVIDCELFARISSVLSFFTGAATRVGFHRHTMEGLYRGDFINRPVLYNPYHHISEQFVTLAEAIDSNAVPKNKFLPEDREKIVPRARISESEIRDMKKRFYGDFPATERKKLVLLYPSGGLLPIRAWPPGFFCELSASLIQKGYAVGIIGMKSDKELARKILLHCQDSSCIDLTGYTKSIRELMMIFHLAVLLITNDGGPGHFAAMTPIKTILFYGPETPALYGPLSAKARVFYCSLSCSPCLTAYNHRNSPCDGDNVCLKSINPEEVLASALELLGAP
ncbi:MAG: glycosyltransferase family 9 protein [bacterium]